MAYEDTELRRALNGRGERSANRVQRDLPETEREKAQRMNPQVIDASDSPPIGMLIISSMTA